MTPVAPVCSHPSLPSCQGTLTPAIPEGFFSTQVRYESQRFRAGAKHLDLWPGRPPPSGQLIATELLAREPL